MFFYVCKRNTQLHYSYQNNKCPDLGEETNLKRRKACWQWLVVAVYSEFLLSFTLMFILLYCTYFTFINVILRNLKLWTLWVLLMSFFHLSTQGLFWIYAVSVHQVISTVLPFSNFPLCWHFSYIIIITGNL